MQERVFISKTVFLLLCTLIVACKSSHFSDIEKLNSCIVSNIEKSNTEAIKINDYILEKCDYENLRKELSILEINLSKIDKQTNDYFISYEYSTFRSDRRVFYVYVNNSEKFNKIMNYEQFTDGVIKSEKINKKWFRCEITDDI